MKKLYEKNEVLFAVLWIVVYCLLTIPIRGKLGDDSPWMLAALAAIAAGTTVLIRRWRLTFFYGLEGWPKNARRFLYFAPMFVLATGNLWGGVRSGGFDLRQLCAVASMALVGYVEEVIFRGFLFKALLRKNGPKPAIVISAVSFGIGHIVNMLAGQASLETVMQVVFAVAWGFLFTFAFYKSGSLWPCIAVHALVDVLSRFSTDSVTAGWVYIGAVIVTALVYCPWLNRLETPEKNSLRAA
ncbi:MAG: CPBP family intramembrane metalloprotease [Clostridia bacterium]|nr:CPBP family intramembrane metalloprotease [Clostridia bacterium]